MAETPSICTIPLELRLEVLKYLFFAYGKQTRLKPIDRGSQHALWHWNEKDDGRVWLAREDCRCLSRLLQVNKQLNAEVLPVLYEKMEVAISVHLSSIGPNWQAFGRYVDAESPTVVYQHNNLPAWMRNVTQVSVSLQPPMITGMSSPAKEHILFFKSWLTLATLATSLDSKERLRKLSVEILLLRPAPQAQDSESLSLQLVFGVFAKIRDEVDLVVKTVALHPHAQSDLDKDEEMYLKALNAKERSVTLPHVKDLWTDFRKLLSWSESAFHAAFAHQANANPPASIWGDQINAVYRRATGQVCIVLHKALAAGAKGDDARLTEASNRLNKIWSEYHLAFSNLLNDSEG